MLIPYGQSTERRDMEKITLETAKTGSELVLETCVIWALMIFDIPVERFCLLYDAIYSFEGIRKAYLGSS